VYKPIARVDVDDRSNAGGVGRNRDSEAISGLTAYVNAATGRCCKRGRRWTATVSQIWHIAGSKRRCWLPEKTKCLWQEGSTLRQRQQNSAFNCTQWQICSARNLTIKDSTRRSVLLKLTTDRHEATRGFFATAELLVYQCSGLRVLPLFFFVVCVSWTIIGPPRNSIFICRV